MVLTSAAFIVAGIACICLSAYVLYLLSPKQGKPDTYWSATEARSTTLALMIVAAFVIGGGLVLKGLLS